METHDPGQTLLEAIFARPDELEPRLVYADWLSTRGDPRGELIALQCQAPDRGFNTRSAPETPLVKRVTELLSRHEKAWIGEMAKLHPYWWRGFPSAYWCRSGKLMDHLEAALRLAPVEHLHLTDVSGKHTDALADEARLSSLRRLTLFFKGWSPRHLRLPLSPHLTGLRSLELDLTYGTRGVEQLGDARWPALEELTLSTSILARMGQPQLHTLSREAWLAITSSSFMPHLKKLSLISHTGMTREVGAWLGKGRSLVTLDLNGCRLSDDTLADLLLSPIGALEHLGLRGNDVGRATVEALLHSPHPGSLTRVLGVDPATLLASPDERAELSRRFQM